MTGKELRKIRERLALTQGQLGRHLRTTLNSVARWERDEVSISEPMALLIEMVAKELGVDIASDKGRSRRAAKDQAAHGRKPGDSVRKSGRC